jgi:hypothetical protein
MAKKQLVGAEINKARAIPQHHNESLQATLCDLELHLQSHEQADYTQLANLLRSAEAELETDHPIVSSVIGSIVRTLANMGI